MQWSSVRIIIIITAAAPTRVPVDLVEITTDAESHAEDHQRPKYTTRSQKPDVTKIDAKFEPF